MGGMQGGSGPLATAAIVQRDATRGATLAGWLEEAGLSVRVFHGALEALEAMWGRTPPDLILTDLDLPDIDGWQLCQLLRSEDFAAFETCRIVVISRALADDGLGRVTEDLGADAVLPASMEREGFLARVRELLAGERRRPRLRALIVSDDERLVDSMSATLVKHGYHVDAVRSAGAATERLRADAFDLAVVDGHLADGDSPTLLTGLRGLQPRCLCLVTTTEATPARVVKWMGEGAAAHLVKPFEGHRLMETVARARRVRDLRWTEALLAERTDALQASDARYERLTKNAPAVFFQFRMGPDGSFTFPDITDQVLELAGVRPSEIKEDASVLLRMIHPEDEQSFRDGVLRSAAAMETYHVESRWLRDGETLWIEARSTPTALPDGGVLWDGFLTDVTARKRAEQALAARTDQLRFSQQVAHMGSFVLDVGTGTWTGSEELDHVLGIAGVPYSRDIEGWARIVHPDQREELRAYLRSHVLAERNAFDKEYRILRANDGEERWVHGLGELVVDADGEVRQMVGTIQDITARIDARRALREQHQLLQGVIESTQEGIIVLDQSLRHRIWNPFMERLTGVPASAVLGRHPTEVFPFLEESGMLALLGRALDGHATDAIEARIPLRAPGHSGWTSASIAPLRDAEGGVIGAIATVRDITQGKQAEEELRRQDIFFEQMFAQSSVSTQILDKDGWCERINPKLSEIFGVEPEHIEGKVYNIFRDEALRRGGVTPHLERVFREGKTDEWEIHFDIGVAAESQGIEVKERKKVWFYNWAYPIFDADGALSRVIIQHTDITERKRREEEQEKLQEQFHQAQKLESVGRLAGGVAHDFNNMLSVILARTEFALDALDPSDDIYADLEEIQQAGRRSADLTRQLLAFARMQTVVPRVLDLNDTTTGMLKMLGTLLGENISLVWRPGDDLWPVWVDGSQIDQVLANLGVNARDAIADVGTVTLETRNVTFDASACAGHPERRVGDWVMWAITDDGHGMEEGIREQIFEPFFTTKELGRGTGLGLATVYGVVQQNGGFVGVHSKVGEGATFSVYLPRHHGQVEDDPGSLGESRPSGRGETVLLVEDEAAILRLVRIMLERLGYRVLAAGTPREALLLSERHSGEIDLLVTDVVMPEMNGRRLAEQIGAVIPAVKCLYMSGYTADVIANQGILTEGIHFIRKPFTTNALAESVRKALEER